jgi:hypothetical protein
VDQEELVLDQLVQPATVAVAEAVMVVVLLEAQQLQALVGLGEIIIPELEAELEDQHQPLER